MAMVKDLDIENFDETTASGVVLVDFWAPWCSACKMLGAALEQVAVSAPAATVIGKVNIDDNKELAVKYQVTSLPTLLLFKNGEVVSRTTGAVAKGKLLELLS